MDNKIYKNRQIHKLADEYMNGINFVTYFPSQRIDNKFQASASHTRITGLKAQKTARWIQSCEPSVSLSDAPPRHHHHHYHTATLQPYHRHHLHGEMVHTHHHSPCPLSPLHYHHKATSREESLILANTHNKQTL